jgi:hypothetical protein
MSDAVSAVRDQAADVQSRAYAKHFSAHMTARLRLLCRASGVLVGAGCESFSDALSDVWTVAARYGAGYLPPESIDALVAALTDEMARAAAEISDTIEAEAAHV